jgi:hypothetical protein
VEIEEWKTKCTRFTEGNIGAEVLWKSDERSRIRFYKRLGDGEYADMPVTSAELIVLKDLIENVEKLLKNGN